MASVITKMRCGSRRETLHELGQILKEEINGELVHESLRDVGGGKVLLLSFEKYYFRNGSYASLTVMITEDGHGQVADIIGSGGGEGLFNVSWGANQSFADMAAKTLKMYGFSESPSYY